MTRRDHKDAIRQAFTLQAEAFAASPLIMDPARLARLVETVDPPPDARVLDVATGPGYVAIAFAERCREVVGLDLTSALLSIAERNRDQRGLRNLRFQTGDAERLPFPDGGFDVVVCRLAFHHLEDPARVLLEMARVCRAGGSVAVEDLMASQHPQRAAYQDRFERLRDPSHTRALPAGELLRMFRTAGLEVEKLYSGDLLSRLEEWLARAHTPPDRAAEVRAMIERDARENLSGARPYRQDGVWFFHQPTIAVVGRKLARESFWRSDVSRGPR